MKNVKKSKLEKMLNVVFGLMIVTICYLVYVNNLQKSVLLKQDDLLIEQGMKIRLLSLEAALCILNSIQPNEYDTPKNLPKPSEKLKPKSKPQKDLTII